MEDLSLAAKIGIGVASVFFMALLIAVVIILCDVNPSKNKRKPDEDKHGG